MTMITFTRDTRHEMGLTEQLVACSIHDSRLTAAQSALRVGARNQNFDH